MCEERAARPASFASLAALTRCAGELWIALAPEDWDQAFRAHPRIGESKARDRQGAAAEGWSKKEQASVDAASQAARDELRATNAAYEAKFGRIYIVCATGKTVDEMVALARERMTNDPATELRRAADEQRRITELRLEKLVLR
jgi:OHCU decarboxylase